MWWCLLFSLYAGISFEKYQYFVSEGDGFVEVCANLYGKRGLTVAVRFYTRGGSAGGTFLSNGSSTPGAGSATAYLIYRLVHLVFLRTSVYLYIGLGQAVSGESDIILLSIFPTSYTVLKPTSGYRYVWSLS